MTATRELKAEREAAWHLATSAAASADVEVHVGLDDHTMGALQRIVASVWTTGLESMLPSELLRALQHSGNYVALATRAGEPIGATVGFLGRADSGTYLHSHITGVLPGQQLKHVGHALKMHQRAWCLDAGIKTITWTYDPMQRRNAHFNLAKLGARGVRFHRNFYGSMTDGLNANDLSDRMLVEWNLQRPGQLKPEHVDGAQRWVVVGSDGAPVMLDAKSAVRWCDVPGDFQTLRRDSPALARRWREAFRDTLGATLEGGGTLLGFDMRFGYAIRVA